MVLSSNNNILSENNAFLKELLYINLQQVYLLWNRKNKILVAEYIFKQRGRCGIYVNKTRENSSTTKRMG